MNKSCCSKLARFISIAMIAAGISACSTSGSKETAKGDSFGQTEIDGSAFSGSSSHGLELRLMTVDDTGNRVAQALARFDHDSGVLNNEDRLRWRSWGLRWVAVPIDQLDAVLGSQQSTQGIQIRSMGEFPQWRPLIRTGEIRTRSVRVGSLTAGNYQPISGRPRLMARVWSTPEINDHGVDARLHLDLAVQMTKPKKTTPWGSPVVIRPIDEGVMIDELLISPVLDGHWALVLIGQDPSIQWLVDAQSGADGHNGQVTIRHEDTNHGPEVPGSRTLGQYMLSTPGTGSVAPGRRYVAPKKVLLVLVPVPREHYRLLGPTGYQSFQSSKAQTP